MVIHIRCAMDRKTCAIKILPDIGRFDDPLDESGGFSCSCSVVTASIDDPLSMAAIDDRY